MKAVVYEAFSAPPQLKTVPDPTPEAHGVVVKVQATGVCRSDWHGWVGHDTDIQLPHVPGHELAGVIVEVGEDVSRWAVGDRVTVPFVCGSGRCEFSLAGDAQVCPDQRQPGFSDWGSFAERVALVAADANLVAIPEAVDFATAASLGCRFATAYRALVSRAHLGEGEWVTVVGGGGVGLSAVMIAKAVGARVVVVDRNPEALAAAAALGADHTLLADQADLLPAFWDLTVGGSHVSVDAVGSEQTCSVAIHSLRQRGRHAQIGLLPPITGHPRLPMERVIGWELDVLGCHGMAAVDYPGMLDLIAQGVLRPDRLVERVVGLDEAADLLPRFDRATVAGMTMIDPAR